MRYPKKIKTYHDYSFPGGGTVKQMHWASNQKHDELTKWFVERLEKIDCEQEQEYIQEEIDNLLKEVKNEKVAKENT